MGDLPPMPPCILDTSTDTLELLSHTWQSCTKCLYDYQRKMCNNQDVIFTDRKPFWVVEREEKAAELAAIQKQEAEEAERSMRMAAGQDVNPPTTRKRGRKKKKGAEDVVDGATASTSATQPAQAVSEEALKVPYSEMTPIARHLAIQKLIESGKAKTKNEGKWILINQSNKQKATSAEESEKTKMVPSNRMPWCPMPMFKYINRLSTLTKSLHKRYVAIKLNESGNGKSRFGQQTQEINEMDVKLKQEREEFGKYVLGLLQKSSNRNAHLPGPALRFLINRTMKRLEQLYGIYSVLAVQQLPLPTVDFLAPPIWWPRMVTALVELGTVPTLSLPNLNRRAQFDFNIGRILSEYPHDSVSMSSVESDDTASKLAMKHGARFVMSASTARLLLLQVPFNRPPHWDIPIIVKKQVVQGRLEPVIYFCKPLPVERCNAMHFWWRYVKMAVKLNLIHGIRSASPEVDFEEQGETAEDEVFSDSAATEALDNLETFGVSSPKKKLLADEKRTAESDKAPAASSERDRNDSRSPSPQLPTSNARIPKRKTRAQAQAAKAARLELAVVPEGDIDTEQPLMIDMEEETETSGKDSQLASAPTSADGKATTTSTASSIGVTDLLGTIIDKMKPQRKTSSKPTVEEKELECVEDAADFETPDNLRTMRRYTLLHINNCLPILVRSNIDGQLPDGTRVSFAPKIEYCPEHGAEMMNEEEWLWHWTTAMLKGSEQHLIVNVHYKDAHCLQIETVKAADWSERRLSEERKFLIASRSKYMADLLARVSQLPDGEYLLQRRSDKDHIAVIAKVAKPDSTGVLDLGALGSSEQRWSKLEKLPPLEQRFFGIDPSKLLVWHKVKSRIPATFLPRLESELPKIIDEKGKKKKKKKNKKKPAGHVEKE